MYPVFSSGYYDKNNKLLGVDESPNNTPREDLWGMEIPVSSFIKLEKGNNEDISEDTEIKYMYLSEFNYTLGKRSVFLKTLLK
jgi:hypothetical protein